MKRNVLPVLVLIIIAVSVGTTLQSQEKKDRKAFLEKGGHKGNVISTMNSGGYTYIEFEESGKKLWAACRQANVSVGDTIEFAQAAPMRNFHSRTLKRTFATILFVSRVTVVGEKAAEGTGKPKMPGKPAQLPEGHIAVGSKTPKKITVEPGSVKKAANGFTVEECYTKKDSLAGKQVTVRGRVVKFSSKIMGRNWIHIRDGSGKSGTDDLTVTTKDLVRVGDLILVTGKIVYNRNFGSGYVFPAIIEDVAVTIEQTAKSQKGVK